MWVVSLELAAVNPAVQEAIRPDRAGWDIVVFDEAHRLTPTAETFHQVGRLLTKNAPRALLMTATPHRGSEWLFRHLLHLVDSDVYPYPGNDPKAEFRPIKPGPVQPVVAESEGEAEGGGRDGGPHVGGTAGTLEPGTATLTTTTGPEKSDAEREVAFSLRTSLSSDIARDAL
jgi:hypothetical protein